MNKLAFYISTFLIVFSLNFGFAIAQNTNTEGTQPPTTPTTLVPKADDDLDTNDCFQLLYDANYNSMEDIEKGKNSTRNVLGCAFKTGKFSLWMFPYLIEYFINFALSIAGLVAVLFIVVGGYIYMFGGLASDKDRGKKAILYGIVGFVIALLSWVIVNTLQILVTS